MANPEIMSRLRIVKSFTISHNDTRNVSAFIYRGRDNAVLITPLFAVGSDPFPLTMNGQVLV